MRYLSRMERQMRKALWPEEHQTLIFAIKEARVRVGYPQGKRGMYYIRIIGVDGFYTNAFRRLQTRSMVTWGGKHGIKLTELGEAEYLRMSQTV
jgi:hypothetical protein